MRRPVPLPLLVAIATAALLPAASAQAGPTHRCAVPSDKQRNVVRLRAKNTSCTEARRVLRSLRFVRANVFSARGKAGSYRCPAPPNSIGGANIRCSGPGGNLVTWSSRS